MPVHTKTNHTANVTQEMRLDSFPDQIKTEKEKQNKYIPSHNH